ncbi:unnamed protein product [Amoebophrya sp. A25]|nr:unnamed protein product [Amoebophrya sp. A25]|eukprot:GSA25T00024961001.1
MNKKMAMKMRLLSALLASSLPTASPLMLRVKSGGPEHGPGGGPPEKEGPEQETQWAPAAASSSTSSPPRDGDDAKEDRLLQTAGAGMVGGVLIGTGVDQILTWVFNNFLRFSDEEVEKRKKVKVEEKKPVLGEPDHPSTATTSATMEDEQIIDHVEAEPGREGRTHKQAEARTPRRYKVSLFVDAGSSGSRIYLLVKDRSTKTIKSIESIMKIPGGMSDYAKMGTDEKTTAEQVDRFLSEESPFGKEGLPKAIQKALELIAKNPDDFDRELEFDVMATAGMRQVSEAAQGRWYSELRKKLPQVVKEKFNGWVLSSSKTQNVMKKLGDTMAQKLQNIAVNAARTIPGIEEGIYGFVAAMYSAGLIGFDTQTGNLIYLTNTIPQTFLEVGGASLQACLFSLGLDRLKEAKDTKSGIIRSIVGLTVDVNAHITCSSALPGGMDTIEKALIGESTKHVVVLDPTDEQTKSLTATTQKLLQSVSRDVGSTGASAGGKHGPISSIATTVTAMDHPCQGPHGQGLKAQCKAAVEGLFKAGRDLADKLNMPIPAGSSGETGKIIKDAKNQLAEVAKTVSQLLADATSGEQESLLSTEGGSSSAKGSSSQRSGAFATLLASLRGLNKFVVAGALSHVVLEQQALAGARLGAGGHLDILRHPHHPEHACAMSQEELISEHRFHPSTITKTCMAHTMADAIIPTLTVEEALSAMTKASSSDDDGSLTAKLFGEIEIETSKSSTGWVEGAAVLGMHDEALTKQQMLTAKANAVEVEEKTPALFARIVGLVSNHVVSTGAHVVRRVGGECKNQDAKGGRAPAPAESHQTSAHDHEGVDLFHRGTKTIDANPRNLSNYKSVASSCNRDWSYRIVPEHGN